MITVDEAGNVKLENEDLMYIEDILSMSRKALEKKFSAYGKNADKVLETVILESAQAELEAYKAENPISDDHNNMKMVLRQFTSTFRNGEDCFEYLKKTYIKVTSVNELAVLNNTYENMNTPFDYLSGDHGGIQEMINLLADGDEKFRGSSTAYKDIQKELKAFKKFTESRQFSALPQWQRDRYMMVRMQSIKDKAASYIKSHETVEKNYPINDYKFRRVALMRKVLNRLTAREELAIDRGYAYTAGVAATTEEIKSYKKLLIGQAKSEKFSARFLSEINACNTVIKTPAKFITLADVSNSIYHSDAMDFTRKAFKGKEAKLKEAGNLYEKLQNTYTGLENMTYDHQDEKLKKLRNGYYKTASRLRSDNPLEFLDNMVYENAYDGCITGNKKLDADIYTSLGLRCSQCLQVAEATHIDNGPVAGV